MLTMSMEHDHHTLIKLIDRLTAPKQPSLDVIARHHVKALCKDYPALVPVAADHLLERLKAPHAQSRLLALEVINDLFTRSRAFRDCLAPHVVRLLELTLGFRQDAPLPPPADAATNLRARALEVIEAWREGHGRHIQQLQFSYNYLKHTLRFTFPDISARRAQREAQERAQQQRYQAWLRERYHTLRDGWQDAAAEVHASLTQLASCMQLLQAAAAAPASAPDPPDDSGLSWQDAGPGALLEEAPPIPPDLVVSFREALAAVRGRHARQIAEWLRVLGRVDVGDPGGAARSQRDRLLVEVTALRGALDHAVAAARDLEERVPMPSAQGWHGPQAAPTDASPAPAKPPSPPATASQQAPSAAGQARGGAGSGPRSTASRTPSRDPTLPRKRALPAAAPPERNAAASASSVASGSRGAVPTSVRQRLLAEAPQLQADSELVRYWEAGGQSAMQGNRGIEIANHWGPVDMDAELSAARRAELFGHVARYYEPPSAATEQRHASATATEGDAQLAAVLQQREADGQRAGPAVRRRIPVRHALERKLLSKRSVGRAQADEERADGLLQRDLNANKFSTRIN